MVTPLCVGKREEECSTAPSSGCCSIFFFGIGGVSEVVVVRVATRLVVGVGGLLYELNKASRCLLERRRSCLCLLAVGCCLLSKGKKESASGNPLFAPCPSGDVAMSTSCTTSVPHDTQPGRAARLKILTRRWVHHAVFLQ